MLAIFTMALGMALLPSGAGAQLFRDFDWLLHRGNPERFGRNAGDYALPLSVKTQFWVYPPTALMPAEMAVNNGNISTPINLTGQSATGVDTPGNPWQYSPTLSADRGPGAWPPSDVNNNVVGDYVFANAEFDPILSQLANADLDPGQPGPEGITELLNMPNVSSFLESRRIAGKNFYKIVDDQLQANTTYYRWSFGSRYPVGTFQGRKDVSNVALKPFQRYAVFIRFPSSSTLVGGNIRPNTKFVFARVSWGANVNDPVTSRIFMLNFDQQGGFWLRIRNAIDDDRYFPFDGVNPIQVTLYTKTFTEPNDIGVPTIVPADAVRLVPEAFRGDIHAPASSAAFPAGSDPLTTPGSVEFTYFGRDETTGPKPIYTGTTIAQSPAAGQFTSIPFDPTKVPDAVTNPHVADSTSSIRSAVFYCIEDDYINKSFSKLRWRYVASTAQTPPSIIDDTIAPGFVTVGFLPIVDPGTETAFGGGWHEAPTQPGPAPISTATWTATLAPDTSYGVFVWIPGNQAIPGAHFATNAHYSILTESGPVDYFLDQEAARNMHGVPQTGGWVPLASGVRFPTGAPNTTQAVVTIDDVSSDIARVVVADAIQFIPESRTRNSVRAAPLVSNVRWPSGTVRQVVYFATYESSQLWALDAIGAGGQSTNTTVYWSYPSVANPDPGQTPPVGFNLPLYDPNYAPDPQNNRPQQGVDGDYEKSSQGGQTIYLIDQATKVPDLARWASSPAIIEVQVGVGYQPYLVIGNTNGKLYAFDPVGRVNLDPMVGPINEPFPTTFATPATPGVPGTTRRQMTWPPTARDKWLDKGAPGFPGNPDNGIKPFPEEKIAGSFTASPTIPVDRTAAPDPNTGHFPADRVIIGATDGHVYCINFATNALDPKDRLSNKNAAVPGSPRWRYPGINSKIDPINQVGTVTPTGQFIFTSYGLFGARIYAVQDPNTTSNGVAKLTWLFPFTNTPPGNPGNPTTDHPGLETPFTAPVWIPNNTIPGFNNGNAVCFVANTDGHIYALDASTSGAVPLEPAILWQDTDPISGLQVPSPSRTFGTTRASAVFLNAMRRSARSFGVNQTPPALIQPLDTGEVIAIDATNGRLIWNIFDGTVGQVPVTQFNPTLPPPGIMTVPTITSTVWRGADATTANNVMYVGDEGNQDTGEMNGQMRTYTHLGAILGFGLVTPDELTVNPEDYLSLDMRLVDIWPDAIWDKFGDTPGNGGLSPFNERMNAKSNTQGKVLIYELGDRLHVAAWGCFYYDPADPSGNYVNFPRVTFTRYSGSAQDSLQATGVIDLNYAGPPLVLDPIGGDMHPVLPWVAKVAFPFDKGNEQQPNVPGKRYTVFAQAQIQRGGQIVQSNRLSAGQFDAQPYDGAHDVNDLPPGRVIALAHPLTLTTRGGFNTTAEGPGFFNIVGWTNNYLADLSNVDISELMANGNRVVDPATLNVVNNKSIVAPLGLVNHGTSQIYMGVDNAGKRVQSLYLADRSNMYKLGKPLDAIHVERRDLAWGLPDPNNLAAAEPDGNRLQVRIATGNVMSPLPWDVFPSMVPNVSPDYPDLDRRHAQMRGNGFDMVDRGLSLPPAQIQGGNKILNPLALELQIDVPRFQPANVNRDYYDMNGALNPGLVSGLLAPMVNSTGRPPDVTNGADPLRGLSAPSAGYTSPFVIYIAPNPRDTRFQSGAASGGTTQTPITTKEDTYRQMAAGVAVPPDVALRTEEETLDIGRAPHSMGYNPIAGATPFPFAPSGVGPYSAIAPFESPWDPFDVGQARFFLPFTVRNTGNVNLVDVRLAKILGDYNSNPGDLTDPRTQWTFMRSDQVESIPALYDPADPRLLLPSPAWVLNSPVSSVPYNFSTGYLGQASGPAGRIGVVSSLDHMRDLANQTLKVQFEIDYVSIYGPTRPNFWSMPNPYVLAGNPLLYNNDFRYRWGANAQPNPTVHKARVGDSSPTTMSLPDTPHGDPFNLLASFGRDTRPKAGVAIPLGTPAGTYSAPLYVFEDNTPEQWREWMYLYSYNSKLTAGEQPGDRDGLLTLPVGPNDSNVIRESIGNPNFVLKATVTETRLTNGITPGSYFQLDNRPAGQVAFGANIGPVAMMDRTLNSTGGHNMYMYFASNRQNNNQPLPGLSSNDIPWYLFFTQLRGAAQGAPSAATFYDWLYEPTSMTQRSWWDPLPAIAQYPTSFMANPKNLFPSETADVPAGTTLPIVPGVMNPQSERHASPSLTQDDDLNKINPQTWMFWQGSVYKTTAGAQNFHLDTRTFYVPLLNGVPNPPGGIPYSFLNDPVLPKYSPKPLVVTLLNGQTAHYLFWHGGAQGRTRLYYNVNAVDVTDTKQWSRDDALQTAGSLQWQAQPNPVHRTIIQPDGTVVDAIDVYYTGQLINHRQSEVLMTRYKVLSSGRLDVMPLPTVDFHPQGGGPRIGNEMMVRDGASQTWVSRDIGWMYRDPVTRGFTDANGFAPYTISIIRSDGTLISPVNTGQPTFDNANGRLYWNSALGGQLIVDPHAGSVTFTSVSPRTSDRVQVTYTPITMRVNTSRNDSGVIDPPVGWQSDAGFTPRSHVTSPGSNSSPVAFLDRSPNPRQSPYHQEPVGMMIPGTVGNTPYVMDRMWVLYKKSNSNVTAPESIYYKTMRLMVRLPRGILLDINQNNLRDLTNHITVANNRGPVEVDWIRGRLYFTQADEGNVVNVTFDYGRDSQGNVLSVPTASYRVAWGDEMSVAVKPGDQTTGESTLPTDIAVNEGQISAFKDPYQDRTWVFWSSTRAGTTDIYYMPIAPRFYPIPGQ